MPVAIHSGTGLEYETDGFVMLEAALKPEIPDHYYLSEAYPNPFNAVTHLRYGMPEQGQVTIRLFDLNGRQVITLVDGIAAAGSHTVTLNGENIGSSVYLVRMETTAYKSVSKVILLK